MRIISGQAGGLPIKVPKSITRPTTDRVREAVFSSLGDLVPGSRVLDLYAGSGALGIECLSRGAEQVVFVDHDKIATEMIRQNLKTTRLDSDDRSRVITGSVLAQLKAVKRYGPYDLIFADPPYSRDEETAQELANLMGSPCLESLLTEPQHCTLILETWAHGEFPTLKSTLALLREKAYGKTRVSYISAV